MATDDVRPDAPPGNLTGTAQVTWLPDEPTMSRLVVDLVVSHAKAVEVFRLLASCQP
jgi:hypothetical protein